MKVENIKRQDNLLTFEVQDEYSVLEVAIDKKFRELSKKIKIAGFRPGKVPKGHFINYYGLEHLSYEALMDLLNEVYPKLLDEHRFDVIDSPKDIEIINLKENEPFRVSISVEVAPEIKIKNYRGLRLEKDAAKVSKEDIAQETQAFLDSKSTLEPDEKASIKEGDLVSVEMSAFIAGEPFEHWTKSNEEVRIGKSVIDKKFDDALIGARLGDKKSFTIAFPDEETYNKDIAGKSVDFDVVVTSIKTKILPKLDDAFIAKETEFKSVDEYKKSIEERLRLKLENAADTKLKEDLANEVVGLVKETIPEVMVKHEVDEMIRHMENNLRNYNLQLNAFLGITGKTLDDLRSEYHGEAIKSVKYKLALDAIAKQEKIVVTEAEIQAEIEEQLKFEDDEEKKGIYRARMEMMKEMIKEPVLKRKVVDWLIDNAKIKKK